MNSIAATQLRPPASVYCSSSPAHRILHKTTTTTSNSSSSSSRRRRQDSSVPDIAVVA